MNRVGITRRIEALEGRSVTGLSAIVRLPREWGEAQRAEAITKFLAGWGLHKETPTEVRECETVTELEVLFAGCMAETLEYVAKHGKRLGQGLKTQRT